MRVRRVPVPAVVATGLLLAGCAPTVALHPAEGAADPACASVTVRLPESIGDENAQSPIVLQERQTDAQATGAWGDPVAVVLRCGLAPTPVSDLPCVTVGSVDWLVDESASPDYRFISYGREPAVEVSVDNDTVSGTAVLEALEDAVAQLPTDGHRCVDRDDATIVH